MLKQEELAFFMSISTLELSPAAEGDAWAGAEQGWYA
jgi:hypothetical protein